jgi:hypothetical protein
MDVPGLGPLSRDEYGSYTSGPAEPPALRGTSCRFVFDDLDGDAHREELFAVARRFLALDAAALTAAAPSVYQYYQDTVAEAEVTGDQTALPAISTPEEVWDHVEVGPDARVVRDGQGTVYVDLECECDWEPEHGLNIVFREGRVVSKVGPYDGHLTNASAFGRDDLGGVVYVSLYT